MNSDQLANALLAAVRAQDFGEAAHGMHGGAAGERFPNLDVAVVAFPAAGCAPVWANVLFSREFPTGLVADVSSEAGPVRNVRFEADIRDAELRSIAWLPGADWAALHFPPLHGAGAHRFVVPYPASLLKLMVAVGVCIGCDAGAIDLDAPWAYRGQTRAIAHWCEDMIAISDNEATSAMVALLHARRMLGPGRNVLHARFAALGLPTLRLDGTRPDGGWGNADGAGVGSIHMTAWDTVRLLWLLDPEAPPPPWPGGQPVLSAPVRDRLLGWLAAQGLHEVLSSTVLAGVPGWRPGVPALLPPRWLREDGSARVGEHEPPGDLRAANAAAQVEFLHKTGTTENYASDAGIVRGLAPWRRHYLVAVISSLGHRHAPHPACATTWKLPALGAAIDMLMARWLEERPAA